MVDDNIDSGEIDTSRRWFLRTAALGTVAGGSLTGSAGSAIATSHDEPAGACTLDQFREYSTSPPRRYADLRDEAATAAQNAETNRLLSEANISAIHALETIARVHYGDYAGGAGEFLALLDRSTRVLAEDTDHPMYHSLRKYTQTAKFVHGLLHDPANPIEEYVELVEEAHDITQNRDAESMRAAMELALRSYDGTLGEDVTQMAIEIGELPLDSAVTGLKVNSQQQLVLKTFAESQQPILDDLTKLTERRTAGTITEKEMYSHFAYRQEFRLAMLRFSNHISHLHQLGQEESLLFRVANEISELLGNDVLTESKQSAERARRTYNRRLEELAEFREMSGTC